MDHQDQIFFPHPEDVTTGEQVQAPRSVAPPLGAPLGEDDFPYELFESTYMGEEFSNEPLYLRILHPDEDALVMPMLSGFMYIGDDRQSLEFHIMDFSALGGSPHYDLGRGRGRLDFRSGAQFEEYRNRDAEIYQSVPAPLVPMYGDDLYNNPQLMPFPARITYEFYDEELAPWSIPESDLVEAVEDVLESHRDYRALSFWWMRFVMRENPRYTGAKRADVQDGMNAIFDGWQWGSEILATQSYSPAAKARRGLKSSGH